MNRLSVRVTALTLAALVGLSPMASASVALGDELHSGTVDLASGAQLVSQVFWSNSKSDLRTERYLSYTPGQGVYPIAVYGSKLLSRQSLTSMSASLESQGHRVLGGVNGDFFDMSTGNALGVLISDGILRTTAGGFYAVGFREDGTAFIGRPEIAVTATFSGGTMRITDVNKTRTAADGTHEGGLYLYTDQYSATTQNTAPGYDVILTPITGQEGQSVDVDLDVTDPTGDSSSTADPDSSADSQVADSEALDSEVSSGTAEIDSYTGSLSLSDQLSVGGRVSCTVDQVLESTGPISIPEGKLVLTVNKQNNEWLLGMVAGLQAGAQVELDVTSADSRWNDVVTAIGGYYKIVTNGQVGPNIDSIANPRTAIGIKADGSVLFYTIDGSQPGYSIGATLTQVAQRLIELGCVEAVGLDGGGSTMLGATLPATTAMTLLNSPSGGSQRAVSNGIFLVTDEEPTGSLARYYVTPYDSMVLSGAQVALKATEVDESGYTVSDNSASLSWSIYNGDGLVDAKGLFTAGSESGPTQITASSGSASGSATVTVVKTPDSVSLSNETTGAPVTTLALSPLETVDLKASAVYRKITLTSQDTCYVWAADPAVGTVDKNGLFTAAEKSGTGNLTVSAGGRSITIPITVAGSIHTLDSFESDAGLAAFTGTQGISISGETAAEKVRYGQQSLRVDYDTSANGTAALSSTLTIPSGDRYLGLWVYGDGSANTLTATVTDTAGATSDVVLTALTFTGWQHILVSLPANASGLKAIHVIYSGGEHPSGSLWLDQFTTANEKLADTTPPTVTLQLEGTQLTVYVSDNLDKSFATSAITLTRDGKALTSKWNAATGALTATLPADDGQLHRVTVTAADQSGNLGRGSLDILPKALTGDPDDAAVPAVTNPFADMGGHWAAPYTTYLYYNDVVKGTTLGDTTVFLPNQNITRAEFALMVSNWMGLDLSQYTDVQLPFQDTDSIPSWAENGVKAMYARGVLKGSLESGVLMVRADATLSRAEAMTILGRIQPQGYAQAPLTFSDADSVPAWALSYVETLTAQGIVSGFENQVRPGASIMRCEVAKMLYSMR